MEIKVCVRCGKEWCYRGIGRPVRCGKCKSPYWDREKQDGDGSPPPLKSWITDPVPPLKTKAAK